MKATLSFDLDDYDDRIAHMRAVKSLDMALALYDINERFRSIENDNGPLMFQKELLEILAHRGIEIDELII